MLVLVFSLLLVQILNGLEVQNDKITSELAATQNWHAVDYFSPLSETSGWIPQPAKDEPPRRRIRKRKRRPPMMHLTERQDTIENLNQKTMAEPWEILEDSIPDKLRRKSSPVYNEDENNDNHHHKKEIIRDPFTALQEEEEKQRRKQEEISTSTYSSITPNIKNIIKQSGSLSEILQKKNISLAELLQGNRDAISALTQKSSEVADSTEEIKSSTDTTVYEMTNRNFEESDEFSSEITDAQRKRISHPHKDTKLYHDVAKMEVVTEHTTDRRIFVPFDDYYQQDQPSTSEKPQITTTKILLPKLKGNLPITSAKLNKNLVKNKPTSTLLPPKAIKIDINEILATTTNKPKKVDGPLRMSIDLDKIFEESTSKPGTTTLQNLGEKLKHVTAKEEIMEILMNPIDRDKLSRILQSKNMTVEELVEQRERGSSQRHLADIFHNKTKEPEPIDEPSVGYIHPDFFQNFPAFRQQKSQVLPSVVKKDLKPDEGVLTTSTTLKPKLLYSITSFPTYKIESKTLNPDDDSLPFLIDWNKLEYNKESNTEDKNKNVVVEPITESELESDLIPILDNHHQPVGEEEENFITLPSGVKSAILASFAIVALSILVFLTILIIFKWNQKQRRRLGYSESFSCSSRIRSPILEPQKRTLRSFMTETLGRKKNYWKTNLQQSMSDSIWDTSSDKKPYM